MLTVCKTMGSAQKEQPLSRRASRATRRCNRSSRPASLEPKRSLLCQRPLTLLPPHRSNLTHALQYRVQRVRSRGRLRARSHPQGDDDHQTRVRCHPIVFAFLCQRPLTALSTHPVLMLTVSRETGSAPKEELLSPRDSRATPRCNRWSRLAPLEPKSVRFCVSAL